MSLECSTPMELSKYWLARDQVSFTCQLVLSQGASTRIVPGVIDYLLIFCKTCLLEAPIYLFWMRVQGMRWLPGLGQEIALNLATHPIIVLLLPWFFARAHASYASYLGAAEIFAILIETLYLFFFVRKNFPQCFAIAMAANLFSWWIGLLL